MTNSSFRTGEYNGEINGAKNAYSDLYPIKVAETDKTEFSAFAGNEGGIAEVHGEVIGQNYSVNSTFYVTAVSNGKESNLSAPCETAGLLLPFRVPYEFDISFGSYDDV